MVMEDFERLASEDAAEEAAERYLVSDYDSVTELRDEYQTGEEMV